MHTSNTALTAFLIYTLIVFGLAWVAHRTGSKKSFLSEYFLGSRGLGMIALALTFGATSASAGSFAGFPALIYSHGWVLALWISSYMIFPLCGMGILGKRLNQIARKTGAITLPDVLRDRFESRALALLSTSLLALLLTVYLIPQFKLAALIMEELLGNIPQFQEMTQGMLVLMGGSVPGGESPEYFLCLILFAALVIVYTALGGFRAVVWTDILQGAVMMFGVLIMLILALSQVGGMEKATRKVMQMQPPQLGTVVFSSTGDASQSHRIAADTWFSVSDSSAAGALRLFRTNQTVLIPAGRHISEPVRVVEIMTPEEKAEILATFPDGLPALLPGNLQPQEIDMSAYAGGGGEAGVYLTAPGPSASDEKGFLPIGLAVSFFVFWALSGTGQPGNMVRLMAFDNAKTLKRAIASLSIYFTLIYVPLVVIFVCARILVPGLDQAPDRIMPVMAFTLTNNAGIPWLAGLIIAAPFAAAMSTVDSFMLMISSSVVRDIYQKEINPNAHVKRIKFLSYACTVLIGLLATLGAIKPPQFLQYIIVFSGGALASAFLSPVALGLYWPRFTKEGAIASMLGGFLMYLGLYLSGFVLYGGTNPVRLLGLDPLIWGFAASLVAAIVATYLSKAPPERIVNRFFYDAEAEA